MEIKPSSQSQPSSFIKTKLESSNQDLTNVKKSNEDYITYTQPNGEQVTYDLKSLRNQPEFDSDDVVKRDMSHLGMRMGAQHSIWINMETGEQTFGQLNGKDKIDEYLMMTDRLNIEQNDKMKYIRPSQDWLDLADKLTDEELNDLVDIMYDISESVFLETRSSKEIDDIVAKLNALSPEELTSAVRTMTHLSGEVEIGKSSDKPLRFGRATGDSASISPLRHLKGEMLRDYSKLMFSDELSENERSTVNEHLLNMDYAAAGGLISSVEQMQGESKQQLFSLLSEHDTEELMEVFSYLGNLANKTSFISQYEIENENGRKELATVFDPSDGRNQRLLIKSILNVEQTNGLDTVNEFIKQTSKETDQVQSNVWQKISESADESPNSLTTGYVSLLLQQANEEVVTIHDKQMKSAFKTSYPGGNIVSSTALTDKW